MSTPPTFTLTLTAREGTIPLTIRNDSGVPLRVSIRLSSPKLEFPDGDTIDLELVEETTRIDIRVRSRATGAFPLASTSAPPTAARACRRAATRSAPPRCRAPGCCCRSVPGVFLTVWWARHWRRTRRSKKLIAANGHPSAAGQAQSTAGDRRD